MHGPGSGLLARHGAAASQCVTVAPGCPVQKRLVPPALLQLLRPLPQARWSGGRGAIRRAGFGRAGGCLRRPQAALIPSWTAAAAVAAGLRPRAAAARRHMRGRISWHVAGAPPKAGSALKQQVLWRCIRAPWPTFWPGSLEIWQSLCRKMCGQSPGLHLILLSFLLGCCRPTSLHAFRPLLAGALAGHMPTTSAASKMAALGLEGTWRQWPLPPGISNKVNYKLPKPNQSCTTAGRHNESETDQSNKRTQNTMMYTAQGRLCGANAGHRHKPS